MKSEEITTAVAEAEQVFWASIAKSFPEVKTGDFDPGSAFALIDAMETAVETWLIYNR